MKKKMAKALILSSIAAAMLYASDTPDYRYSITPMIGVQHAISKKYLDEGTSYGARFGYNFDSKQSLELGYDFLSSVDYNNFSGKDTDVHQLTLNYLYNIVEYKIVQPYFLVGLGYEDFSDNVGKLDDGGIGDLGVGLKYFITKNIPLRFEIRDIARFDDGGHTLAYTAGLEIPFGKVEKEAPKPLDSDNDGVIDSLDKCPNTPAGTPVDKNGCALDSDNDGVIDSLDKCPNTPAGFKVDKNGCAVSITMHINFETNKAVIPNSYLPMIDKLANFLKDHPQSRVILEGYTDNRGRASYNLKLSKLRSDSVAKELIKRGIDASRITTKGFGESNPIASNDTVEGRAQNRRVEAIIVPAKK